MLVSAFHYDLPEDLIAQQPPPVRGASSMLTLDRATGEYRDCRFADLPSLLQPGDLLVLNDSRVIPARLYATRAGMTTQAKSPAPSGLIEVLLTERLAGEADHHDWAALVRPAKKVQPGETLHFHDAEGRLMLRADVIAAGEFGERTLRFAPVDDFHGVLERIGHLPLPPYIRRDRAVPDAPEDRERYQTVYSQRLQHPQDRGSAAAPTAGLHFTPEILAALHQRGVEIATITLHVGLGTFQPVRVERTEDIRLHAEHYSVSQSAASAIHRAHSAHRRILAVGTTVTRTLEHLARESERTGQPIAAQQGSTRLFLSPEGDSEFKIVRGLLTNFHLPESTLLMLVSAFAGRDHVLAAYAHAVQQRYRFFSYGDCMLIV